MSQYRRSSRQCNRKRKTSLDGLNSLNTAEAVDNVIFETAPVMYPI